MWPGSAPLTDSMVYLHDKDMKVILKVYPDGDLRLGNEIVAEERCSLRGYGKAYLYNILNSRAPILDTDPIWEEILSISGGFALHISRKLVHDMDFESFKVPEYPASMEEDSDDLGGPPGEPEILENFDTDNGSAAKEGIDLGDKDEPEGQPITLDAGNIVRSAQLLFHGLRLDVQAFSQKPNYISSHGLHECIGENNTVKQFLKSYSPETRLFQCGNVSSDKSST